MNNTLSHSGLSYSHPSYAAPHPSSTSPQSSPQPMPLSYPQKTAALHQNVSLPPTSRTNMQQMHPSQVTHQNPPSLSLPLHMSSNIGTNMYPQTSVYINPYVSMLSPTSQPSSHHHHHLHHHSPTPLLPPHHHSPYIAPPAAFSITNQSGGGENSSSGSSYQATPYGSSATSHPYGGVVSATSGALVPYNQPYQQQQQYPSPPPPYMPYTVSVNSCSKLFVYMLSIGF